MKVMDIEHYQKASKGWVICGKLECDMKPGMWIKVGDKKLRIWAIIRDWKAELIDEAKAGEQCGLFIDGYQKYTPNENVRIVELYEAAEENQEHWEAAKED